MSEAPKKSGTRDTFESLVVTVILALFGTTFVLQAFKIPTGSMENTLLVGDHLIVNKFAFADAGGWWAHLLPYRTIERDDVVVFKFPYPDSQSQEPGEHLVKRVIGLGGKRSRSGRNSSISMTRPSTNLIRSISRTRPIRRVRTTVRSSSRRGSSLSWAITATTAQTAGPGDLSLWPTSKEDRGWSIFRTRPRRETPRRRASAISPGNS